MKYKLTLSLFLLKLFCLQHINAQTNLPKIYALVVGISKYADANIPSLKFAEKDAEAFALNLQTPAMGAIPLQNMTLLTNEQATRSNVLKALVQLLSRSGPEDLFIFYFAGHGKNDELENSGYLLTYDTENGNEAGTAVSMDDVNSKIGKSKAKMKVSYVDACHAGLFKSNGARGTAADNGEIIKAYQTALANATEGNVAFLAASARQQSLEDDKLGHGVFTYYVLKGLSGEADKEQKEAIGYDDGVVTVSELQTYITRTIDEATKYKQKPAVEGIVDGDFPLSVLKTGTNIAGEIKKRPKVEKKPEQQIEMALAYKIPESEKMPENMIFYGQLCQGQYAFINKTLLPVVLYEIRVENYYLKEPNLIIVPNATGLTPRMSVWPGRNDITNNNRTLCYGETAEAKFYFKIVENGIEKYSVVTATVEAGKKIYMIISKENTNFTIVKPY